MPVGLGNSTTYAGTNNLVAHHAVIAATHVFSPTFIVDARFGYGRFNLHALKDGAEPGANLGEKLGVKNSNQGPFSYGLPIFSPASYTGIGGPASMPTIRLENTFNPNISFTKIHGAHSIKFGTNIVRRQIIDFQTNQGDGLFSFDPTFTSDPNNTGRPAIRWRVSCWARRPGSARIFCWCGRESARWKSGRTCRTTGR